MEIWELVRHRRLAMGMTQEELADCLGVDQTWVSQLEKGRYKRFPSPERIAQLAKCLHMSQLEMMRRLGYIEAVVEEPREDVAVFLRLEEHVGQLSDKVRPELRENILSAIALARRLSGEDPRQRH